MADLENDFFAAISQHLREEANTLPPDPEQEMVNKSRAIEIAKRQADLVRQMHNLDDRGDERIVSGYSLYSEVVDQAATNKLTLGLFNGQISPWYSIDHIGLHTFDQKPHQGGRNGITNNPVIYFPQYFDIDTPTLLWVGKPTDKAIKTQVDELLQRQHILLSQVYQIYIFGEDGQFGHISGFPRTIIDKRPDIGHREMVNKHVVVPMSDDDFATAEVSLTLLEAAVR